MTTAEVLALLKERDLTPAVVGSTLVLRGRRAKDKDVVTSCLVRVLLLHKTALLALLTPKRSRKIVPLPDNLTAPADSSAKLDSSAPVSIDRTVREFRFDGHPEALAVIGYPLAELPSGYPYLARAWRWKGEEQWRPLEWGKPEGGAA